MSSTDSKTGVSDLSNVSVLVRKGPLPQFSHALEGHLRERLKLPVRLNEGTIELLQEEIDFF